MFLRIIPQILFLSDPDQGDIQNKDEKEILLHIQSMRLQHIDSDFNAMLQSQTGDDQIKDRNQQDKRFMI